MGPLVCGVKLLSVGGTLASDPGVASVVAVEVEAAGGVGVGT